MVKKFAPNHKETPSCSLDQKPKFSADCEKIWKLDSPIAFRTDECLMIKDDDFYLDGEKLAFKNQTMPLKILVIKTMLEIIQTKYKNSMKPLTYSKFSTVLDQLMKTVEKL